MIEHSHEISISISDSSISNSVEPYQIALVVVIPVFIIIIIAMVVCYVKKHHPQLIRKKSATSNQCADYENEGVNDVTKWNKNQANAPESAYDEIDPTDINMSSSVYDMVDTERVEYETVH